MIDLIHILHNSGTFDYRLGPLMFFLLACVALVLALLWVIGCSISLLTNLARKKPLSRRLLLVTLLVISGVALLLPRLYSRICYAWGYQQYLAANLSGSGRFYLEALRLSPGFMPPLEGLVAVCLERDGMALWGRQVEGLVQRSGRADLCRTMARNSASDGRYAEAATLYGEAERLSGTPGDALERIGALLALGDLAGAEAALQCVNGSGLEPRYQGKYNYLAAVIGVRSGRLSGAADAISRAVEAEPACPEYLIVSGQIQMQLGDTSSAVRSLQRALGLRPDLPSAHFALGSHYYLLHNELLARQSLEKAIYYDNSNVTAAVMLQLLKHHRFLAPEQIRFAQPSLLLREGGGRIGLPRRGNRKL